MEWTLAKGILVNRKELGGMDFSKGYLNIFFFRSTSEDIIHKLFAGSRYELYNLTLVPASNDIFEYFNLFTNIDIRKINGIDTSIKDIQSALLDFAGTIMVLSDIDSMNPRYQDIKNTASLIYSL